MRRDWRASAAPLFLVEPRRIVEICGRVQHINILVDSSDKADGDLRDESLESRIVVSGAVEVEIAGVEFAAGVGETICCGRPGRRGVAEGLKGIARLHRPRGLRQGQSAAESIRQETPRTR